MNHRSNIRLRRYGCLGVLAFNAMAWAALIWLLVSLCGCTTTKYVPVETVRTEYRDHDVERLVADTVHDTRFVFVKGDPVERPLSRWEQTKMDFGGFALGALAAALCIAAIWLARKFRK